jgi:phosphoglycolate phosphatase-like HAD superfamily hydrolase
VDDSPEDHRPDFPDVVMKSTFPKCDDPAKLPSLASVASSLLPPADAYVFDIDGTLLNSRDLVHWNAFRRGMIEAYGVDATIEGIPVHGMTDVSILRAALTGAGVENGDFEAQLPHAIEVLCREVERNKGEFRPQICPGVKDLLHTLHGSGRLLGVASGNLESVGWHKIAAAGLRQFFSFGSFSDHCESRAGIFRNAMKEAERRLGFGACVCFIGDTPADVHAAKEVGAPIVAVATGIFSLDQLKAGYPSVCITNCFELLSR